MPSIVQTYVDTHDIGRVIAEQNEILELYRLDIAKYANGADKVKIKAIFDSIPSQLNGKNKRFILTSIDEHGRQNRYANSFEWLAEAGVALPCRNVTEPQPPLQINEKHNLFKLFLADTGLLCAACMENIQFAILQGNVEQEGDIVYLPWYMVMFYKHSQIEKNMTYQVDISNLE